MNKQFLLKLSFLFLIFLFLFSFQNKADSETITPIAYGQTVTASISQASETDKYQFTANAGDKIYFRSKSYGYSLRWRLYDDKYTLVSDVSANGESWTFGADILTAGTYYIYLSSSNSSSGNYEFTFQRTNNPSGILTIYGKLITGTISHNTEIDVYKFSANVGDIVALYSKDVLRSSTFQPLIVFLGPDGNIIDQIDREDYSILSVKIPKTGIYSFFVRDSVSDSTGNYSISLQKMSNSSPIRYGDYVNSSLSQEGEVDSYQYTALAGDKIYFRTKTYGYGFLIFVYNAEKGWITEQHTPNESSTFSWDSPVNGIYYIFLISSLDSPGKGNYEFTLQKTNLPAKAVLINYGSTVNGSIDHNTEIDVYKFTALPSDIVTVNYKDLSNTATFQPRVTFIDPSGKILQEEEAEQEGQIKRTLLDGGTYYLFIRDVYSDSTGKYQVILKDQILVNVSITTPFFNPTLSQTTKLNYTLKIPSNVTIEIYYSYMSIGGRGDGTYGRTLLRKLIDNAPQNAGAQSVIWSGKDAYGKIAQQGVYTYVIRATNATMQRDSVFDPEYIAGGVSVTNVSVNPSRYNPYSNEPVKLNYTLSAPAWVTIGGNYPSNFPGYLLKGVPRKAGTNVEIWDGRDGTGNMMQENFTVAMKTEILPVVYSVVEDTTLKITDLKAENYRLLPVYGEVSTIKVGISRPANLTLRMVSPNGSSWVVAQKTNAPAGTNNFEWSGKNPQGQIVDLEGNYRLEVTASDAVSNINVTRIANIRVYK